MASKLKLTAEPTFKVKVGIPVAGAKPVDVEFTFKHRKRSEMAEWVVHLGDYEVAISDCATSWDLDDDFNAENIERLLENYPGSGEVIVRTYLTELAGSRAKN